VTLINTKGMAFIGPGSEWFWAALQFTALAITFIAIYRQLRIARSSRAVEQVQAYSRQFGDERNARYRLAILVALRDEMPIPLGVGIGMANYFEDVATLSRSGHLDVKLLWNSLGLDVQTWWLVLEPVVRRGRAINGAITYSNWEWLVGKFVAMDRRAGGGVDINAEYFAKWRAGGVIERIQDRIRVEEALRSVIIAPSHGLDTAQPVAAAPTPSPPDGENAAEISPTDRTVKERG
jgi:hypothetical protein